MNPRWFKSHVAYTMAKYGMSMCTLGMAEEFKATGIAVNSLWPRTTIATMAIKVHFPEEIWRASRWPSIVADAAEAILTSDSREITVRVLIYKLLLRSMGVEHFDDYAVDPTVAPYTDLFLDESSF
jgi:citronellol/citronellal dehydrogenase